ncbi:Oidioi.mRNA.OKI2018_I69.chr1.g3749.t1.cds [Oikopleura dioica]|uniref:Oidioi.mRNA.OKI2018_I69.chr1.g3749.t1.cds n=1 Tax=Oikopleura dioica TaxID=34765 RepID=A0ABN7SVP1_OIKDI|nr:Oidioi.mRNA.OKI2018_I69.chr1.g3749.t1.cds [Oikopleura dioica]
MSEFSEISQEIVEDEEVAGITEKKDNEKQDDLEKLVLSANCGGMLGLLQARTCANPNTAAEEVNYFKTSRGKNFRLRPRTPVRKLAKRDVGDVAAPSTSEEINEAVSRFTTLLSPVVKDETLARFLVVGYKFSSPMARAIEVPVLECNDDINDDDLESDICNECVFCERDQVRHHRTKKNEHTLMRALRSPCRCSHEEEHKKKNYDGLVKDPTPVLEEDKEIKVENGTDHKNQENQNTNTPANSNSRAATSTSSRKRCNHDNSETCAKRVSVIMSKPRSTNEGDTGFNTGSRSALSVSSFTTPVPSSQSYISKNPPSSSHQNHHHQHQHHHHNHQNHQNHQNRQRDQQNHAGKEILPRPSAHLDQNQQAAMQRNHQNQQVQPLPRPQFKVEPPQEFQRTPMLPHFPHGHRMGHPNFNQAMQLMQQQNSLYSQHQQQMPAQRADSVQSMPAYLSSYRMRDSMSQMIRPDHPMNIKVAFNNLALKLGISRSIPKHTEQQVTDLLQIACEVRRDQECDYFFCPWQECPKFFNRRDSLVRHLRVHVDVRSFQCEKCDQRFLRSDHLRVHMLRHTGEQPFACIVCGNTFARKDLRNRHMKATHYKNERPPQRVLDLLEGASWDDIPI